MKQSILTLAAAICAASAIISCRKVSDFNEVMSSGNTHYCDDPEECMADNFAFAMMGRTDLPNTKLLEDIRQLLKVIS